MIDPPLGDNACATRVSHLVYGGSCNGGAYAVIAALSVLSGRNLLITPDAGEDAHSTGGRSAA